MRVPCNPRLREMRDSPAFSIVLCTTTDMNKARKVSGFLSFHLRLATRLNKRYGCIRTTQTPMTVEINSHRFSLAAQRFCFLLTRMALAVILTRQSSHQQTTIGWNGCNTRGSTLGASCNRGTDTTCSIEACVSLLRVRSDYSRAVGE